MDLRRVAVATVGRSDYGLYRPVLAEIEASAELELVLIAAGAHLSEEHGATLAEIEADGYAVAAKVAPAPRTDDPVAIAASIADGVRGFAAAYERLRPDLVLVLGDRYEVLAAAVAALPLTIPVAHLHGGESTEGLIDEGTRHAVTKLSHIHFPATEEYAQRIVQMGEEPWRVHVVGAPGLDAIRALEPMPRDELERLVGMAIGERTLLVTYHPVTLEPERVEGRVAELLDALERSELDVIFTAPNADTRNATVSRMIRSFAEENANRAYVTSLGSRAYLSLLANVRALVGNSSSGIIEAASFELPVVNVGSRQQGRLRTANVLDADDDSDAILAAIRRATSGEFRAGLRGLENPYGDGRAAPRIVAQLASVPLDERLLIKRFHDL